MTGQQNPGTWLLDRLDTREATLTCETEQVQAQIDELTAQLSELRQAIEDLRISRKTLLTLAEEAEPTPPSPVLPDHPAYQQILTVFAEIGQPMRARDLCQALDLPISRTNAENIRAKLKRLVSRGVLVETEPGLFSQPRP